MAQTGVAEADLARGVTIPFVRGEITIDAVLDEPMWADALVLELPIEIDPGENVPAPVRTECLLAYDEDALYIGFRAHDPDPSQIRAHLTDRDSCFRDDMVGVMLDTFNDERRGFEFFVNPLGVQMDLARNEVGNGNDEDDNWDALWDSAGRITAPGYVTEMRIPFSSLRFPSTQEAMTWGIIPFRAYPRTHRHQLTSFANDRNRSCFICQATKVTGFAGAKPGRNLEITPTVTARRTDRRQDFPTGPLEDGDIDVDPGLSVQWGITSNLALNGTLNPDFSQVEADVAQLAVNRRFALFFPEKRPFFLEGRDFFDTPFRAVHTRAVSDPDYGLKVTGKAGRNAFGAFVAQDDAGGLLLPGSRGSRFAEVDGGTFDVVARYRRDIGGGSTLGVVVTGREGDDYSNYLAGFDGLIRIGKVDKILFQGVHTVTEYPEALADEFDQKRGSFSGQGLRLGYERGSRNWDWWGGYTHKDEDFRADLGFITQANVRGPYAGFQRNLWPRENEPTWFTQLSFGLESDHTEDLEGELVSQYVNARFNWNGPYQARFESGVGPSREQFEGTTYELMSGWTWFNLRPTGDFTSSLETNFGDAIDYDNGRQGSRLNLTPGLTYDPGRHLRLQLDHTFERLTSAGDRVYTANLTQLKTIYQFTTRMYVRAILQYQHLDRNASNYRDEVADRDRSLFSQLLFSYKLSPQSLFHIGYSEDRLGENSASLKQRGRTVFLKVSYAWLP